MQLTVYGVANAVADPELTYVGANKTPKCVVNLAFTRTYQQNGERKQDTTYLYAEAWGKRAERLKELASKGKAMFVTGYLKQSTWTDDNGQKRSSYTLSLDGFRTCEQTNGNKQESPSLAKETVPPEETGYDANNDVPF